MESSWRRVKEEARALHFWQVYDLFIRLAYQPISVLQGEGSRFNALLLKVQRMRTIRPESEKKKFLGSSSHVRVVVVVINVVIVIPEGAPRIPFPLAVR